MKQRLPWVVLLPVLVVGFDASAQMMMQRQLADPAHPATQNATAVAEALLTGDAERAVAGIAELAAPAYRDGSLAEDVRGYVRRLGAPGRYRLDAVLVDPQGNLLLLLRSGEGADGLLPIRVRMEVDPPHRITGLEPAQVQIRRPQ